MRVTKRERTSGAMMACVEPACSRKRGTVGRDRQAMLGGIGYDEAEALLKPEPVPPDAETTDRQALLDQRRNGVLDALLSAAIRSHPGTAKLFGDEDRDRTKSGRGWASRGEIVNFLHDQADEAVLVLRGSQRQLDELIRRKAVLAIYGLAVNTVCVELAKVTDPEVFADMAAWRRQMDTFYASLVERYLPETVQYYRDNVGNRQAWKQQAPFLRAPALCTP